MLALQYANSAEISRINKGLKRRANQTVFGFYIDPRSGYWAKSEDEDPDVDVPPDVVKPVRIVPIVRDRKNALLFRFSEPAAYAPKTIATVQHALMRGIEVVFQLEEGEDSRRASARPRQPPRRSGLRSHGGWRRGAQPSGRGPAGPRQGRPRSADPHAFRKGRRSDRGGRRQAARQSSKAKPASAAAIAACSPITTSPITN